MSHWGGRPRLAGLPLCITFLDIHTRRLPSTMSCSSPVATICAVPWRIYFAVSIFLVKFYRNCPIWVIAADATRVGILQFGKSVTIPVSLGGYHERDELLDGMRGMSHSNAALGVPDIGAAYRAAVQQFDDFGRDNEVPRVLLLFSSGEDMFMRGKEWLKHPLCCRFPDSSARQSLTPMGAFLLLVGPSSYDAEIAEESSEHIFVDKVFPHSHHFPTFQFPFSGPI